MLSQRLLEWRQKHIGSSEVAAIMGISPYETAGDVWMRKVHGVQPPVTDTMLVGTYLEPGLMNFAEAKLKEIHSDRNLTISRANCFRVHTGEILCANVDGWVHGGTGIVDCCTVGASAPIPTRDDWGEPGTDQVPDHKILQAQAQMACAGARCERVHLAVYIGCRGMFMYEIPRNEQLIGHIVRASESFWNNHVETQVCPPLAPPSPDTLRLIGRVPNRVVEIPDALYAGLEAAKEAAKAAQEQLEIAKGAVLAAMGTTPGEAAELARCTMGEITYFEQSRTGYQVEPTTFRVLKSRPARP